MDSAVETLRQDGPLAGGSGETGGDPVGAQEVRLEDLAQIIGAYNDVTANLRNSYESLKSQVVRLQSELASTNVRLQRSKRLAALGEMAAGIAHEIRNPLAAIQLYADVLAKDLVKSSGPIDGAGSALTAKKIVSAVRGLNGIVNDVLSFSREIDPNVGVVCATEVFDRAVEACRPEILAGRVSVRRLDRSVSRGGIWIEADEGLMHQVGVNLIRNAVQAIRDRARRAAPGVAPAVLTLDAGRDGARASLVVRDSGSGIAEEDIDRIFNPFFTTRNTGTGLGLAIVHRIIDAHGGTIGVHNDGGAVFTLDLPTAVGSGDAGGTGGSGGVLDKCSVGRRLEPVVVGSLQRIGSR